MKYLTLFLFTLSCNAADPSAVIQSGTFQSASFATGGAAGGGGSPAWGGEIGTRIVLNPDDTGTSKQFTTSTTVNSGGGNRIVVLIMTGNASVSGVTDDAGNTYTGDLSWTDARFSWIHKAYSAPVTATLNSGAKITVNFTGSSYSYLLIAAFYLTGTTAKDVTPAVDAYNSVVSIPGTTTAAAACIGVIQCGTTITYSSGNWNSVGTTSDLSIRHYFIQKDFASGGSQNPGGTLSGAEDYAGAWVSYK